MLFDTNLTLLEEYSPKLLLRNSVAEKQETEHLSALRVSKEQGLGKSRYNFFFLLPLSACFPPPELSNQTQNTG